MSNTIIKIIIVTILLILNFKPSINTKDYSIQDSNIKSPQQVTIVKDRNDFFTVASCVSKYIQYITRKR